MYEKSLKHSENDQISCEIMRSDYPKPTVDEQVIKRNKARLGVYFSEGLGKSGHEEGLAICYVCCKTQTYYAF